RVHHVPRGIRDEQHIALVDSGPAADRGTIHAEAVFKRGFVELFDGIRNVVPETGEVGETDVEKLSAVFLGKLDNGFGISHVERLLCAGRETNAGTRLCWGEAVSGLLKFLGPEQHSFRIRAGLRAGKSEVFIEAIRKSYRKMVFRFRFVFGF